MRNKIIFDARRRKKNCSFKKVLAASQRTRKEMKMKNKNRKKEISFI
jgi:hypothetical protein